jgi:hypothetical protein
MSMRTIHVLGIMVLLCVASGCGTYKITYRMPSNEPSSIVLSEKQAHGLGPAGGGGFFFVGSQVIPCFFNWTGPVKLDKLAPKGFYEISQYHTFGQNTASAFITWLIIINPYYESTIDIKLAQSKNGPTN